MKNKKTAADIEKPFRHARIIFITGAVMIALLPFLLTRNSIFNALNFTNTGQIGDTIGGISAPFVSLLGSVLVYYALKAQVQANRLIQSQIDDQQVEDLRRKKLSNISSKIQLLSSLIADYETNVADSRVSVTYRGVNAINITLHNLRHFDNENDNPLRHVKLQELYAILDLFRELIDLIVNELEQSLADMKFNYSILRVLFTTKIKPAFDANVHWIANDTSKHGIPIKLYHEFEAVQKLLQIDKPKK